MRHCSYLLVSALFSVVIAAALFRISDAIDLSTWADQWQTELDEWCSDKCKHFDDPNLPNRTVLYEDETNCLELLLNITSSLEREVEVKNVSRLIINRHICDELWRDSTGKFNMDGITEGPGKVHDELDNDSKTKMTTEEDNSSYEASAALDLKDKENRTTLVVANGDEEGWIPVYALVIPCLLVIALVLMTCYFCAFLYWERLDGVGGDPNLGDVPLRAIRAPGSAAV